MRPRRTSLTARGLPVPSVSAIALAFLTSGPLPAQTTQSGSVQIAVPGEVIEGEQVTFRAEAGDTAARAVYTWDFGDGSPKVSGADHSSAVHTYVEAGIYLATLTVTDPDGEQATRQIFVGVAHADPDFVGEVAGEVPKVPFRGVSGPSAAFSGMAAVGLPGAGLLSGDVIDLSGMSGACLINAGFWDDRAKTHINFVLTLPSGPAALEPGMYSVSWKGADRGIAPGQLLINALVLWSDPSYEETKQLTANPPDDMQGGEFAEMIMRGLAGGEKKKMGPGRNWQLTATTGAVIVENATPEAIEGRLQAYLGGPWEEAESSGQTVHVQIEGNFTWRPDDAFVENFRRCTAES